MRALIQGVVQQVLPVMDGNLPKMTTAGQPIHRIYLIQNGDGRAPEIAAIKYIGKNLPKPGDKKTYECSIQAWKLDSGKFGFTASAFDDKGA